MRYSVPACPPPQHIWLFLLYVKIFFHLVSGSLQCTLNSLHPISTFSSRYVYSLNGCLSFLTLRFHVVALSCSVHVISTLLSVLHHRIIQLVPSFPLSPTPLLLHHLPHQTIYPHNLSSPSPSPCSPCATMGACLNRLLFRLLHYYHSLLPHLSIVSYWVEASRGVTCLALPI